jgi:uncharacterized protein YxjI
MLKIVILVISLSGILLSNSPKSSSINIKPDMEITQSGSFEIPNSFKVSEKIISYGCDFNISSGGKSYGKVEEKVFRATKSFKYYDNNGGELARATQSFLSWGVEIKVYDNNNKHIGTIKEEIFESLFSIKTIYSIYSPSGKMLATSKKLDFIGTDIEIFENGISTVVMKRPMFNLLSDDWSVDIKSTKIDKRILIFIPCYKTSADNKRKEE